jgi:calcineurin-like phosphoesterase family protein
MVKNKENKMSNVYFCSDPHLGHDNIVKHRDAFHNTTPDYHDNMITNSIVAPLTKRDDLWILGDVCIDKKAMHHVERIAASCRCVKIILGNHDLERGNTPSLEDYLLIPNLEVYGMVKYKGIWLTHAPIHPEELRGNFNMHGHVHKQSLNDKRYLNVSMEAINYKPIDLATVNKYFRIN